MQRVIIFSILVLGLLITATAQARPNKAVTLRAYGGIIRVGAYSGVPATTDFGYGGDISYVSDFFEIGGGVKARGRKNCVALIQPRAFINLRFNNHRIIEPYFGGSINYSIYDYNCPAYKWTRKNLGFGGQVGLFINASPNAGLFLEGQIDSVNLNNRQVWILGGAGGAFVSF